MTGETVGGDNLEGGWIVEVSIEVEGNILVRELIVKKLSVENATLRKEMTETDVIVTCHIIYVRDTCTTWLTTHIRHAVACSCRHSHHIIKIKTVLHKTIEHTARENSSHSSAFKHQSLKSELGTAKSALLDYKVAELPADTDNAVLFEDGIDTNTARNCVNGLVEKYVFR